MKHFTIIVILTIIFTSLLSAIPVKEERKTKTSKEGAARPFSCGSLLVDNRDNKSYKTVQIGSQCWMAENLNIGKSIKGYTNQKNNSIIEKYCYDGVDDNCDFYGGLYQWDEMMDYSINKNTKGICPIGWHIPSDKEWQEMEISIGMSPNEVKKIAWRGSNQGSFLKGHLKSKSWVSEKMQKEKTNFNALPSGYRFNKGTFKSIGVNTVFWSSSEDDEDAINRYLFSNNDQEGRNYFNKKYGFSVRCIKN